MSVLTDSDRIYARALRDNLVLEDIDYQRLDVSNGVIVVMCCDGDQFADRYCYLQRLLRDGGCPKDRIHPITRHGGALRLAEGSPLNKPGRTTDLDLLDEIEEAAQIKDIRTVLLEMHGPCAKAYEKRLSLHGSVLLHIAGKLRAKAAMPHLSFASLSHIDWGGSCKRYYRFNRVRFQAGSFVAA